MVPEYTTVVGIDAKHLRQLCLVWLTWKIHKPSLLEHPMIIFFDRHDEKILNWQIIKKLIDHPNLEVVAWPPHEVHYPEVEVDSKFCEKTRNKFGNAQRYKMMAGFVHIPARHVKTPYWLKLDSDAVALGQDNWINPEWFRNDPFIVAHPWGFTKPANQPKLLDDWADSINLIYGNRLNLPVEEGSERISHKRISSWCGFFRTQFTEWASEIAEINCGKGLLPVPSQDTYLWYLATRRDPKRVIRAKMKSQGWTYRSSYDAVKELTSQSLSGVIADAV